VTPYEHMDAAQFLEKCKELDIRPAYWDGILMLIPATCDSLPPEIWRRARELEAGLVPLVVQEQWEREADELIAVSIGRIDAEWRGVGRDDHGPHCTKYDEEIAEAYRARDREGLEALLKAREELVLSWLAEEKEAMRAAKWAEVMQRQYWPEK
jgi:hypothetical protein